MERACRGEYHSLLNNIRSSPLFLYSSTYILGIFFAGIFPSGTNYSIIFSTSAVLILTGLYYFSFYETLPVLENENLLSFLKISLIFSFFALGILSISLNGYYESIRRDSRITTTKPFLSTCQITDTPKESGKFMKFSVKSLKFEESILVYLNKNLYSGSYEIGDTLIINMNPLPVTENDDNKNNFNYSRYLKRCGIYSTAFVTKEEPILKKAQNPGFRHSVSRTRERAISKLYTIVDNPEIHATLVALTTGVKSYLTDDIRKSFGSSGTMHLLAVSGLHVVFIYSMMLFITSIFGNFRYTVIFRGIIIISMLWIYALFTGLAPSIERAVIMATIYQIGTIFEKKKNSLNSLSFSALIICIFSPGSVFDIGFQLSFVATLSIIAINPFIYSLYRPKNYLLKHIWTTLSISISCQIGTSILTVYYFKFIPVYFMLSNLIAIPLSSIIITCTLLVIPFIGTGMEPIFVPTLKFLVGLLNKSMEIISALPCSTINF